MELLIVMVVITIIVAISTINFNSWQKKYAIEAQVKEMLTDLSDVRMRAITTKQQHIVLLNPTSYSIRRYSDEFDTTGTEVLNKTLQYPIQQFSSGAYTAFSNTPVTIDVNGYTTDWMTIAVGVGLSDPAFNCLAISWARVNMGKINGNNCVFK